MEGVTQLRLKQDVYVQTQTQSLVLNTFQNLQLVFLLETHNTILISKVSFLQNMLLRRYCV